MVNQTDQSITLRLEGSRATDGVSLPDFEKFIDSFLAALRDFDRSRRGESPKKAGHPESRAQAVTAFRLVAFRKGSGIATIEPDLTPPEGDTQELVEVEPIQITNLKALLVTVEAESELPVPVSDALDRACQSVGEDGSLSVEVGDTESGGDDWRRVVIDAPRLARIRANTPASAELKSVSSVSGQLHRVDFEPDRLAIRATDGVDWECSFPEELEEVVEKLVNRLVWAAGNGTLRSPRKGTMQLDRIESVDQGLQTALFSSDPAVDSDLAPDQGIVEPQGLDSFGFVEWGDSDEAYLEALTEG